jgi:hypothetical protein
VNKLLAALVSGAVSFATLPAAAQSNFHPGSEWSAALADYVAKGYFDQGEIDGWLVWSSRNGNLICSKDGERYAYNCEPPGSGGAARCQQFDLADGRMVGRVIWYPPRVR